MQLCWHSFWPMIASSSNAITYHLLIVRLGTLYDKPNVEVSD